MTGSDRHLITHVLFVGLRLGVVATTLSLSAAAQRLAVLAPDKAIASRTFSERLVEALAGEVTVLDTSLAEAGYAASSPPSRFNLTAEETRHISSAIGCDFLLLVRSEVLRRSSFQKQEYYEAYAVVWLASARSGRLVFWKNYSFEAPKPSRASESLASSVETVKRDIGAALRSVLKSELSEPRPPELEEPPDPASPLAKNFRAPVPYRRLKPEYTAEASLYDITATVEIVVDLDENGRITRTDIVRWAGYGLDGSVEKAVRSMNWRPAERSGKPLPMRFLLRYNFRKADN